MDGHFYLSGLVVIMLTYQIDNSIISENSYVKSRTFLLPG